MMSPTEIVSNVLDYFDTQVYDGPDNVYPMFPDVTNGEKADEILASLYRCGWMIVIAPKESRRAEE